MLLYKKLIGKTTLSMETTAASSPSSSPSSSPPSAPSPPAYACLLPPTWAACIPQWLAADVPKFDAGGFVVGDAATTARLLCKSPGVLAGVPFVDAIFQHLGCTVSWRFPEGYAVSEAQAAGKLVVATVAGPTRCLLLGERTALNLMARASGIATAAARLRGVVDAHGWHGEVAGTRKTTPGFGLVEKYALLVGGASTHRMDLSNMIMLKDNHIWSAGGITGAVRKARRACGFSSKIEVECRDLAEAVEAATSGADVVMLDNFSPEDIRRDAATFKAQFPHVMVEASGGIREHTIAGFLCEHVDVISMGALTQGYGTVDFSMKLPRPASMAGHRNTGGGGAVMEDM
jgi:nicotinate-nucleotide pyrophosphorylase (carboxylating)